MIFNKQGLLFPVTVADMFIYIIKGCLLLDVSVRELGICVKILRLHWKYIWTYNEAKS